MAEGELEEIVLSGRKDPKVGEGGGGANGINGVASAATSANNLQKFDRVRRVESLPAELVCELDMEGVSFHSDESFAQ